MSVAPQQGLSGTEVTVTGTGFLPGATVALDGLPANVISTGGTTSIRVITPLHAAGAVDVVVTNPGGVSERLNGGFTYEVVILTVSPNVVTSGEKLQVSWVVPPGRSSLDWIGLFRLGESNENYLAYLYTQGATSGTLTFIAPEPGQYDFRYLLDDGYRDIARSDPVTVNAWR